MKPLSVHALVLPVALIAPLALAATPAAGPPKPAHNLSPSAQRGLDFAQARCASCHGVTANASSPNPESPAFEDVANASGLSRTTLRRYLSNSHNFPEAMQFTVTQQQMRDLSDYIITLRHSGHRPAI